MTHLQSQIQTITAPQQTVNKLIYTKHNPTQGKWSESTDRLTKIKIEAENKNKADPNVLNLLNLSNKDRQTENENRGTYKES